MLTFDEYACYYNVIYGDKDYRAEAEEINRLINEYSDNSMCNSNIQSSNEAYSSDSQNRKLLNLGCGTGKHDREFEKLGYKVKGIDLSPKMIEIAETECIKGELEFECGDIRKYRDSCRYDICTSLFHVISYQISNQDLLDAFLTAAAELKDGGLFIFDVWYGPGVLTEKPEVRIKQVSDGKRTFIRHAVPIMYAEDNTVDVNYEVLAIDNLTNIVKKMNETHKMRYWFSPEIKYFLEQAGFELLACLDCKTLSEVSFDSWTAYFIARKC